MTTRYVDPNFAAQGATKVWRSGTVNAVPAGSYWYTTITAALAASSDGDVIKLSAGSLALPASIAVSVRLVGVRASMPTLTGSMTIPAGKTVRISFCEGTPTLVAKGNLVLEGMGDSNTVQAYYGGACIVIGDVAPDLWKQSRGAYERYPAWPEVGRWPSGRTRSFYRNPGHLEAPAKYRNESGEQEIVWVPIDDFRFMLDERMGGERETGAVIAADQTAYLYCRPGPPFHPDMRITSAGRTLQIKAVARPNAPGDDVRLTVTERTGME